VPNPELREMIDLHGAARLVDFLAGAALGVTLVALALSVWRKRQQMDYLRWAAAVAPWSLLIALGWRVYLWRVRFDPATGFCGLHSVRTLLGNVAAALVLGLLYGVYLRWLWGLPPGAPQDQPTTKEG